jgi:acyl dehydratase
MRLLSFDALNPGDRFVSNRRTLTEADHSLFMMLVGDWSPIHADAEFAAQTPAGQRLIHGSFGIALALGLQTTALEFADPFVAALGIAKWSYKAPLFIGDTVYVDVEIAGKRVTSDKTRYVLERRLRLFKQGDVLTQEGLANALLKLPAGVAA